MRPFRVLGVQQIAFGAPDKRELLPLWVDLLGLEERRRVQAVPEHRPQGVLVQRTREAPRDADDRDGLAGIGAPARTPSHELARVHVSAFEVGGELRRRRVEADRSDRFVERILGLDLSQRVYDRGRNFVDGVDIGTGDQFDISGVAPHANLISYLGCCSVSGLTNSIDQAIDDGVDVINYSIGSPSARSRQCGAPSAAASTVAARRADVPGRRPAPREEAGSAGGGTGGSGHRGNPAAASATAQRHYAAGPGACPALPLPEGCLGLRVGSGVALGANKSTYPRPTAASAQESAEHELSAGGVPRIMRKPEARLPRDAGDVALPSAGPAPRRA